MKKRIGNDITFTWHIYRKDGDTQTPESFDGKDVEVKLISPLHRPVTIEDVSIATGVVTFTFRGKHQVTLGNYVAVLQENKGENGMVTLDVVNAVTLVAHSYMEEDGDDGDVIEAESVELTSTISAGGGGGIAQVQADWEQDDDTQVDYIKNKPDVVEQVMQSTDSNVQYEARRSASGDVYTSVDTTTGKRSQSVIGTKDIYIFGDNGVNMAIKNDSIAKLNNGLPDSVLWESTAIEQLPVATTSANGLMSATDKGKLDALPTVTQLAKELGDKANTADLATVATSGSYNDLTDKPTIPTVPTNVSAFTNDAGYITEDDMDDVPTPNSNNLVKSGGVYGTTPSITNTDAESDMDISDEQRHAIVKFQNGHIKTKNFDSSKDATTEERGLMSSVDKAKLNSIEEGAEINNIATDDKESSDLDFADENNNVLVRFADGHIKTKKFDSSKALQNRYLPYQRRTYFAQSVNTFNFLTTNFIAKPVDSYDEPVYYNDNVVLYLPESYSENNSPTKLIIYCKPGNSTIEPSSDIILGDNNVGRIFRYMLHLGYGILAADGVPNGWASALKLGERAVGNYVAVQSTIRAFEYVKNNYNIDCESVFIFGYSQGGHYAQNVIDNSNIPIVAAAELSPVCSMRYHQWDLSATGTIDGVTYTKLARLNIARIFDFPAVSNNQELLALQYDASKTIGYDPWNRNVENMYEGFIQVDGSHLWRLPDNVNIDDITMKKHCKCPLKIWAAQNDGSLGVDVMKVFIKAIKNSGQVADLQLYTSGGHTILMYQNPIGTFVEHGENCNLYPVAFDIASWFFQFGGYELV